MKMKRAWILGLTLMLCTAMAVGGTLAYLSDTKADVNVMTLGSVYIEQIEQKRNGSGGLTDFTDNEPLFPVPGAPQKYIDLAGNETDSHESEYKFLATADGKSLPNVQDKIVSVKNIGKSDAYVRTLIAFEVAESVAEVKSPGTHIGIMRNDSSNAKDNKPGNSDWSWEWLKDTITVDEQKYAVAVVTHNAILPKGETTIPSLLQVYMKSNGDNEYVAKLGDTYEILVVSQAVQTAGFADAKTALNTAFGVPSDMNAETGIMFAAEWFGGALDAEKVIPWNGTADTSWYNGTDTEFVLTTAEQLAGLAELVDGGNTFAGKTVKLGKDIDLKAVDDNGNRVCFEPIGDASNADFSGIFNGQKHTISNLYQDCNSKHLALFGAVYEGTVKNLTLDNARVENDGSGYAGGVASYAGAANFENITLKNSTVVNYNHNTAGIVAWCSNNGTTTTFDGINIEESTTIGSWWGSYDTRVGGIVGAMNTGNNVVIKNSTVACKLDVYNDVTSNYQWWNYRMAGMVVADVRDNETVDGRTQANPARVTCENVTVIFGDWANYHYCESASYGTPSYADEGEYKFRRVEPGLGYGGVDTSACNHAADETHNELIAFDCLFGARDGKGIYGISEFNGVTVEHK